MLALARGRRCDETKARLEDLHRHLIGFGAGWLTAAVVGAEAAVAALVAGIAVEAAGTCGRAAIPQASEALAATAGQARAVGVVVATMTHAGRCPPGLEGLGRFARRPAGTFYSDDLPAAVGVLGTGIAFVIFYELIARVGPARTFIVTYLAPVFAVGYGVVLLDESFGIVTLAGLLLILAGSYLAAGGGVPRRGAEARRIGADVSIDTG